MSEDEALARKYGVPAVQLGALQLDPGAIARVPKELAVRLRVMPVAVMDNVLILAMADPANVAAADEVNMVTRLRVERVVAAGPQIDAAIAKHYG